MPRPRLYRDAAAKQRAYRERLKARRRAGQGPSDAELGRAVRDLHIRLEYEAAVHPGGAASKLVGKDALASLRNAVARLAETEQF
jgi:hypothetical protein